MKRRDAVRVLAMAPVAAAFRWTPDMRASVER